MRLPRPRDLGVQSVLWDWVDDAQLDTALSTRTYIGDFFEEATVQLYRHHGAHRLVTDSTADVCPDIAMSSGWIETKSLGRGSNVIIYEHSVERYKRLQLVYPERHILFALWRHKFQMKFASRQSELYEKLALSIESVLMVPLAEVLKVTSTIAPQPLRIRSEGPHQMVSAWRLPKSATDVWYAGQQRLVHDIEVYGVPIRALTVLDGAMP